MAITYFTQDYKNYDYKPWVFPDLKTLPFRGPDERSGIADGSEYIVFLGSAQTFGRFVEKTFCERYGELSGIPCINLATGGDSPEKIFRLMNRSPEYKSLIQNASHVICQVISPKNLTDDDNRAHKHPNDLWSYGENGDKMFWIDFLGDYYFNNDEDALLDIVSDLRQKYASDLKTLLGMISGEKTLLYLHRDRDLSDTQSLLDDSTLEDAKSSMVRYLDTYPQLISQDLLDDVTSSADRLISYDYSSFLPSDIQKTVDVSKEDQVKESLFIHPNLKQQFENIKNKRGLHTDSQNNYYPPEDAHVEIAQLLYDNISQA